MADFESTFKGCSCLIPILIILACFVIGVIDCNNERKENPDVYLVKQTGYIHKSDENGMCRFYDASMKKGYTMEKLRFNDASKKRYKICIYCFSIEERARYIRLIQKDIELKKIEEDLENCILENEDNEISYPEPPEPEDIGGIYSSRQHP